MRFKEALEEARNNRAAFVINDNDGRVIGGAAVSVRIARPVQINLSQDQAAATRVVRAAARRVITQHRDEIEALAYK